MSITMESNTRRVNTIIAGFEAPETRLESELKVKRQMVLKPIWDNIPQELKALNRFVPWHYVINKRRGKVTKEPYLVDVNTPASKTDSRDWLSFDAAKKFTEENDYDGVWLVLTEDDPYCAVDLDRVISDSIQKVEPYAERIVDDLNSYTEISPSGQGYRIFVKASIPKNSNANQLEMYKTGYVSVTGNVSGITAKPIQERGWQTRDLYREYFGEPEDRAEFDGEYEACNEPLRDTDILRLEAMFSSANGKAIERLWDGDLSSYEGNHSKADAALCSHLGWWFDYSVPDVDRLFRHSKLIRSKWNEVHYANGDTYGWHTTKFAFGNYKPGDGFGCSAAITDADAYHAKESTNETQKVEVTAQDTKSARRLHPNIFSAADLMNKEFKPVDFVIPNFLPTGLTMLTAKPKIGKSWLALDMCLQVANGGYVLGQSLKSTGDVLYLSLEDSERRLKDRINKLLQGEKTPNRLELATNWDTLDNGGLNEIAAWIARVDNPRLIVIDTLIKCMPTKKGREEDYAFISKTLAPLQRLALDNDVAIILVHHLRKNTLGGDDFDAVMGSQAYLGIADTTWVIKRNRMELEATLSLTSRDIDEKQVGLSFDKESCKWGVGDAATVGLSHAQRHVYEAIKDGFDTPKKIAERTEIPSDTIKKTLLVLLDKGLIHNPKRGVYLSVGAIHWE